LLQHKIDLFSAGFKYNAGTEVSLTDSQKALLQLRSDLDSPSQIEERAVESLQTVVRHFTMVVGGVHTITEGQSVRLFTLGSASRGIPPKEWKLLAPVDTRNYRIFPGADVIAFGELQGVVCVHLSLESAFCAHANTIVMCGLGFI
jgi:hypothetical protein